MNACGALTSLKFGVADGNLRDARASRGKSGCLIAAANKKIVGDSEVVEEDVRRSPAYNTLSEPSRHHALTFLTCSLSLLPVLSLLGVHHRRAAELGPSPAEATTREH